MLDHYKSFISHFKPRNWRNVRKYSLTCSLKRSHVHIYSSCMLYSYSVYPNKIKNTFFLNINNPCSQHIQKRFICNKLHSCRSILSSYMVIKKYKRLFLNNLLGIVLFTFMMRKVSLSSAFWKKTSWSACSRHNVMSILWMLLSQL